MFTVKLLIDSFLTHLGLMVRAGLNKPATLQWYTDQFRHLDPLGAFPAEALRTHHLAAIPLTNAFVRVLKRVYKWGVDEELLPKNPFAKLAMPPCGRRERVLTRTELRTLYRAAGPTFRRLLFCQLNTLARPGEIRQLTWGQIDWGNRVITLTEFKGKKARRDKLKERTIAMPRPVQRLLGNLYRKAADRSPEGRVFLDSRRHPWTQNGARCAMRRARKRAGLDSGDEKVVCYHLRHTSATNAVRKGLNLKLIAEMMGHARTTTTERYLHLNRRDLVDGIDKMNARPKAS